MGTFQEVGFDKKARLLTFYYDGNRFGFDATHLSLIEPLGEGNDNKTGAKTIEAHLGLPDPHDDTQYSYALHFKAQGNDLSKILIDGPIELVELSADFIYVLPQLVSSRVFYTNVLALGESHGEFFFLLKI